MGNQCPNGTLGSDYYNRPASRFADGYLKEDRYSDLKKFEKPWPETQQGIFDAVLKGHIDFDSDPWPKISESAKNLIRKMLCPCPSERLKAHEVLRHPWICENGVATDQALDPSVLSRLKQFSAMNKLKKLALRVIAERLSEEEIAGLRQLFKAVDVKNRGVITLGELREGLRRYGTELEDREISDIVEAADKDNNVIINYEEFIAATVPLNKIEREEHLMAAFTYFDKDGSGYITVDKLQRACGEHNMEDSFLEEIILEVDQNNDGQIDYTEFVAMMQGNKVGLGWQPMETTLNVTLRDAPQSIKHPSCHIEVVVLCRQDWSRMFCRRLCLGSNAPCSMNRTMCEAARTAKCRASA
ncbi:hypothetical protein C2845_PM01G01820 [Panicum miliaceum]|uniref:non-specific serine/threonine protein kinase n=1 Tax=Panicum miliaceum TaxID=4540 RepID=A0A3L6TKN6_PANMI|nr:hypothetical protein C2845_PM01G01820 [Panicum miliaceum]